MTTSKEQVLELISSGKVSATEGEELLKSLQPPRRSRWTLLTDPFDRLTVPRALVLGLLGSAGGLLLSRWGVRFGGAIDVNVARNSVSFSGALADQIVAWPVTALILWLAALVLARRGRAIDFLGNVGVARLPLLLSGALAAAMRNHLPTNVGQVASGSAALLVFAALSIPPIIWMMVLLYRGFRTASGLSSPRGKWWHFAFVVVIAEILSKIALYSFRSLS